jgi:N-acetylglutamate synthase
MRCTIKPMSIADYDDVLALWQKTEGVGLNESDTRTAIAAYLKRNPGMSFIARDGRNFVGAVLCGHDGRRGYLHHLAVSPSYRRKGLGTKLVSKCLASLKKLRIVKCNIFLFTNNTGGERFWQGAGWKKRSELCLVQKDLISSHRK